MELKLKTTKSNFFMVIERKLGLKQVPRWDQTILSDMMGVLIF